MRAPRERARTRARAPAASGPVHVLVEPGLALLVALLELLALVPGLARRRGLVVRGVRLGEPLAGRAELVERDLARARGDVVARPVLLVRLLEDARAERDAAVGAVHPRLLVAVVVGQ